MITEPEPFAVDLSNDGIFLWHRKPARKWEFLGSVPLNSGNLRQQLEALTQTVLGIDAPSNAAIVRIPSAEVKTLTVAHDPDAQARWEVRIVASLEATAGLSIKELAFDIDRRHTTPDICVAWTPMTVIRQAETFVHLIGFDPTYYTTDLDIADFPRNPSFQVTNYQAHPDKHITDSQNTQTEMTPPEIASRISLPAKIVIDPKATPRLRWFIPLFFLIAILIAAIYYWPHIEKSADSAPVLQKSSYLLPSYQNPMRFTLKKVRQSYS